MKLYLARYLRIKGEPSDLRDKWFPAKAKAAPTSPAARSGRQKNKKHKQHARSRVTASAVNMSAVADTVLEVFDEYALTGRADADTRDFLLNALRDPMVAICLVKLGRAPRTLLRRLQRAQARPRRRPRSRTKSPAETTSARHGSNPKKKTRSRKGKQQTPKQAADARRTQRDRDEIKRIVRGW